ncbi:ABC transporter permease [Streptomyces sp. GC420]|uniref:ABC transporter permease n=1 Tax=Streptomyces sp. GC420 TaxID=2697568 RepID=UPI0014151542|nr:ABC transporter permease [Streptomyces sp. GC420]NBM19186.1 ABC transporter permease [Streptomyces sp. GC420]
MSIATGALLRRETACAVKVVLRNPQTAFLVVVLPLLYLFVLASIFDGERVHAPDRSWTLDVSTIMTASVVVVGVVSAAFQNLAMTLVEDREYGVLKRLRSTPVPAPVFLAGHVVTATVMSVMLAVLVACLGVLVFDVPFPGARIPAAAVTVLAGTLACCLAAIPFSALVRRASASLPMAFGAGLTLFFLSGNFFPGKDLPVAMQRVADVFPVRHFFLAMLTAFDPHTTGAGFEWGHLAVLGIWAVAGAVLSVAFFRWTPTGEE